MIWSAEVFPLRIRSSKPIWDNTSVWRENTHYNFLSAPTIRCVIPLNAVIARRKSFADPSVDPAMKDFAFNVDPSLLQKNNAQLVIKWWEVNSPTWATFVIFVGCPQPYQESTPMMIILVTLESVNFAMGNFLRRGHPSAASKITLNIVLRWWPKKIKNSTGSPSWRNRPLLVVSCVTRRENVQKNVKNVRSITV